MRGHLLCKRSVDVDEDEGHGGASLAIARGFTCSVDEAEAVEHGLVERCCLRIDGRTQAFVVEEEDITSRGEQRVRAQCNRLLRVGDEGLCG